MKSEAEPVEIACADLPKCFASLRLA